MSTHIIGKIMINYPLIIIKYHQITHLICYSVSNIVDDIDLWTGLYTETKVDGSAVGPLLNCLLGKQFEATKFGDRHWYQNTEEHSGFKPCKFILALICPFHPYQNTK